MCYLYGHCCMAKPAHMSELSSHLKDYKYVLLEIFFFSLELIFQCPKMYQKLYSIPLYSIITLERRWHYVFHGSEQVQID